MVGEEEGPSVVDVEGEEVGSSVGGEVELEGGFVAVVEGAEEGAEEGDEVG